MTSNTVQALLLVLCASIMNAAYALPMKLNKKWEWEHSWFAFSVMGVAVVPTVIALFTVPGLWSTYSSVSIGTLAAMVAFGASWGVSLVFFGLALTRLGLAITFAVCLGTSAAVGALTPLIAQHSDLVMTRQGGLIFLGVLVILFGVALCGLAGKSREAALQQESATARHGFVGGLLLAFVSGILGSMLNLGLAFGGSIQRAAQQHGASLAMMSNAVWLPCLYAGFLPGAIYCLVLMRKNHNTGKLALPGTWYYWLIGASMGFLWFGSIILYSISTVKLGDLGTSIGWPLFLASIVVASTVFGVLTGEWRRTGTRPLRTMILGVSFLVAAIAILSYAGRA
ncbi:MAG TPA: L-rhamnose/proton symporter RhaT [Terriglobales bacterium]|nr:L-rhamnose/proton symporter RhaT [Terriglobales bacterium]